MFWKRAWRFASNFAILSFCSGVSTAINSDLMRAFCTISLGHDLCLLRCSRCANLRFIERRGLFELRHLLVALSQLLHQRLDGRLFLGDDVLHLRLLRLGQIEVVGVEAEHVAEAAAMAHALVSLDDRLRKRGRRHRDRQHDCEKLQSINVHCGPPLPGFSAGP